MGSLARGALCQNSFITFIIWIFIFYCSNLERDLSNGHSHVKLVHILKPKKKKKKKSSMVQLVQLFPLLPWIQTKLSIRPHSSETVSTQALNLSLSIGLSLKFHPHFFLFQYFIHLFVIFIYVLKNGFLFLFPLNLVLELEEKPQFDQSSTCS